jgi:hypothetical protein
MLAVKKKMEGGDTEVFVDHRSRFIKERDGDERNT